MSGKKQNLDPMWKVLNKEVDLGEPTSSLRSCILGMHSTTMPNKQRYCGQLQNHVRIANFSGRNRKTMQDGTVSRLRFRKKILRIRNPLLEEHCAFVEVIHLFQEVGCARNKLLFRTVQQNLKLFLWTLD